MFTNRDKLKKQQNDKFKVAALRVLCIYHRKELEKVIASWEKNARDSMGIRFDKVVVKEVQDEILMEDHKRLKRLEDCLTSHASTTDQAMIEAFNKQLMEYAASDILRYFQHINGPNFVYFQTAVGGLDIEMKRLMKKYDITQAAIDNYKMPQVNKKLTTQGVALKRVIALNGAIQKMLNANTLSFTDIIGELNTVNKEMVSTGKMSCGLFRNFDWSTGKDNINKLILQLKEQRDVINKMKKPKQYVSPPPRRSST